MEQAKVKGMKAIYQEQPRINVFTQILLTCTLIIPRNSCRHTTNHSTNLSSIPIFPIIRIHQEGVILLTVAVAHITNYFDGEVIAVTFMLYPYLWT